jgi:hypothetical protein
VSTRRASTPIAVFLAIACAVAVAAVIAWAPWRSEHQQARPIPLAAPVAAGTSAANIKLSSSQTRVMVRWVARSTGTLAALHLRVQADGSSCRQNGKTEYGLGDGGSWHVTTSRVLADGRPDAARTLTTDDVRPCEAPQRVMDLPQGIARLPMGIKVTRGTEYASVIANDDPDPANNYTSINFLFTSAGLVGANGRNERSMDAKDAYYGLDPRELVGYSLDSGRTWALPGGQYGARGGRSFLPTYLQEYSDGRISGQPYYYATAASSATRTMEFRTARRGWTIRALGAYTPSAGRGTLTLAVDGRERAKVTVTGSGFLRAPIAPVTVPLGKVVTVTESGLAIQNVVADTAWGQLAGLFSDGAPWRLEGTSNRSEAAPVYPLPRPPA